MNSLKERYRYFLTRLNYKPSLPSPAYLLPVSAGILILLLSVTSFFIPGSGSSSESSPSRQFRSTVHTVYKSFGVPVEDEFGLTKAPEHVEIKQGQTDETDRVIRKEIKSGESLFSILSASGLSQTEVYTFTSKLKDKFSVKGFRTAQTYEIETNPNNSFKSFSYHLNTATILHLEKDEHTGELDVWQETLNPETRITTLSGTISGSLSRELQAHNRPALVAQLKELFSSKVNFQKEIHPGASYRILFEEQWIEDKCVGIGKILAVEISSKNRQLSAYRFADAKGNAAYYDDKGLALRSSTLFTEPCSYSHVSSGFGYRVHPITGATQFHGGVDLAAPVGTPVRAVADGKIIYQGRTDGSGNMITMAHGNDYHTQYLHLSRFSPAGTYGRSVQQGEIIGYVGSTGSSTGPHLDFRIIKSGKLQNPLAALSTVSPAKVVARAEMGSFLAKLNLYRAQFGDRQNMVASVSKKQGPVL